MELHNKKIYPIEPWNITEDRFCMENNYRNETTFALSNGYIGTRGTFEEDYDFSVDEGLEGNFINGFYESEDIRYGEWNFGFPLKSQSLLNLPNGKPVKIYVDNEQFDMRQGRLDFYQRTLNMENGTVVRSVDWTSPNGIKIRLLFERMVSFADKNVMVQRLSLLLLNRECEVRICSYIDGDVENHTRKTNPLVDYGPFGKRIHETSCSASEELLYFEGKTKKSGLTAAFGVGHSCHGSMACQSVSALQKEAYAELTWTFLGQQSEKLVLDKFIVCTSSLDMQEESLFGFVEEKCRECNGLGYGYFKEKQTEYMKSFWDIADVGIQGDEALQQGIRFNLFHIMQAAGRDGRTSLGAKGLSGEGYEGHYFWDTEMYVLPVFVYTAPELAKKLLEYRYHTLDQARARARVLGHEKGALYPWRTINGEEASTYFPLGTAQYHINGDIAYAFQLYVDVSGDREFLKEMAAEVLCETARVWADVGCFAECRGNQYCICAVTGPDEYNAIVDNNFYTNLMARENIRYALKALELLKETEPQFYQEFIERLSITDQETAYWERIVENMYFPYDEKRQVYPLDDGFMMRKPWDDSRIPVEKRHLLYENYHPLFIYRQRMSKQADAILGMYLHSNLFTKEELKRNYDFYQEVTLHHSSLSTCIFGILASEIGYQEEAYEYFSQSARMDLDDYHNNFYAGIHAANMAGTWLAIVNGFAGLRTNAGMLAFHPFVPKGWKGYTFRIQYRGSVLEADMTKEACRFTLISGCELELSVNGKKIKLTEKEASCCEKI
ncbi:glycoside hydrolase family 65 protein [uncultured Robinsoniella sp.]|uniref:glycoside hydrolase family 65 protein n=1 Tax=Robinsoniella sp. TaxID=2496533 RepID=UPI00374FC0B5